MGWNETDQEDYEITEADKKMFQDLYSKQVFYINDYYFTNNIVLKYKNDNSSSLSIYACLGPL